MVKSEFKYHINHYLSIQPQWRSIEMIGRELQKEGIPERTFYRDRSLKAAEAPDIPAERLMIYARFFDVPIDKLFNYTMEKVKPIDARIPSAEMKRISKRTGLKLP